MKTKISAIISGILVLCMLLPCTALAVDSYSDVPRSHWAHGSISRMTDSGLLDGKQLHRVFEPSAKLLPTELFAVLLRMSGEDEVTPTFDFCGNLTDSPADSSDSYGTTLYRGRWFRDNIFWAAYNGLIPVTACRLGSLADLGTYRAGSSAADLPHVGQTLSDEAYYITVDASLSFDGRDAVPVTRTDVVTALYLYAEKYSAVSSDDASASAGVLGGFTDSEMIPNADTPIGERFNVTPMYANLAAIGEGDLPTEAWSWAVESGLVIGYPNGTLRPEAHLTRAEFAVLLDRYVSVIK